MKYLLAAICLIATIAWAESTAIIVTKTITIQIDMVNQSTNVTYQYVFSVPQPVGQLQDSVTYSTDVPSEMVSNDVAVRAVSLLNLVGADSSKVSVIIQ